MLQHADPWMCTASWMRRTMRAQVVKVFKLQWDISSRKSLWVVQLMGRRIRARTCRSRGWCRCGRGRRRPWRPSRRCWRPGSPRSMPSTAALAPSHPALSADPAAPPALQHSPEPCPACAPPVLPSIWPLNTRSVLAQANKTDVFHYHIEINSSKNLQLKMNHINL